LSSAIKELVKIEEPASPPLCSSCRKPFTPGEYGVEFPCPNCGKVTIRRCKKCRKLGVKYECPCLWICGTIGEFTWPE
jgi:predicted RNA-binding Zn-ribbon protein involved in translation (DUF1610 family)